MRYALNYLLIIIIMLASLKSTAQSKIVFSDATMSTNTIISKKDDTRKVALLLQSFLDKSSLSTFSIQSSKQNINGSAIFLSIENSSKYNGKNAFTIQSDNNDIYLTAPTEKLLRYAVYTLLENLGFRKFSAQELYIPNQSEIQFPKNVAVTHSPSFEYRALYYPDAFDPEFRDWHKLDWHLNDFSIWGHSFDKLVPPKEYFKSNPEYFAFYEGRHRPESLCMTNKEVVQIVESKIKTILINNPSAAFTSISQNDEVIFCECKKCKALNLKYGGPQGSLYFFLNKIAKKFPTNKIVTLAYQHTLKPPLNLKIQPNIYTLICPIDLNRGKTISVDATSKGFVKILKDWRNVSSNLYLWDYTVQFSNYLSPFPNIHTFSENYKFYKQNNIKGIFVQGYADVPGDFSELRQYLLAKLLWNTDIDIASTTADFLRGFYGNAAPFVQEYLNLLNHNQIKSNQFLDIYSGPIQSRKSFLSTDAIDSYDIILERAAFAVHGNSDLEKKIRKLRMSLEFVFFEQAKFYGADQHGMFNVDENGYKIVKNGLNERVANFAKLSKDMGIYELCEDGISPDQYYKNWLEITKNTAKHLGEKLDVKFISEPSTDYMGKGATSLVDGIRGHKDFNINWVGWYGNDAEIEINTDKLSYNEIEMRFLANQRNWIFVPESITILGLRDGQWIVLSSQQIGELVESAVVASKKIVVANENFSKFGKIKIKVINQKVLPFWRERKNKKPMIMIDEVELYNR